MSRALPVLLALLAALADRRGAHGLALYALLGSIPFTAVASLRTLGEYVEARADSVLRLQALLWAFALALLVLSCAVRSPASTAGTLPPLGASALVCCLVVFALKAALGIAPLLRRAGLAAAKP